jgi:hypothetical protein
MSVNGTLVEAKLCTFTLESMHFIFNKCPIYTSASAKFSTNSHETDYSVGCSLAWLGSSIAQLGRIMAQQGARYSSSEACNE